MMVGQTPDVNFDRLLKELDHAATKLSGKENQLSKQELTDLLTNLKHANSHMDDPSFWAGKKLDAEGKGKENETIAKALRALEIFQNAPQKNLIVQQAVVSLYAEIKRQLDALNCNLKNLKDIKYRIGQKVEKTRESKQT